jgi:hypothetical protein
MSKARQWLTCRFAGAALAAAVFAASFAFRDAELGFAGDEPSYLLYATSLGRGWGVDLQRASLVENRTWISSWILETHAQVWRPGGPVASWHGIGLPLVLAPLAGRVPQLVIRLFMIGITSVLAYHLLALVRRTTGAPVLVACGAVLAIMASPPVIFHASLVYPETLAGLLVVIALRCLTSERPVRARLLGASISAALLPWLNARYGTLTIGLGVLIVGCAYTAVARPHLLQRLAATLALVSVPAIVGLGILAGLAVFNLELYGTLLPGSLPDARYYRLRNVYVYGVGGLIGFPLGILPFAPLLMVALVSVPWASGWIGARATAAAAGLATAYWLFNGYFGSAGLTLPGRYFVSTVPLLAVPLTVVILRGGALARLAVVTTLVLTIWSTATSAAHLQQLYAAERRNIRPFGLVPSLWPMAVDETFEGVTSVSSEAGDAGSQVGTREPIEGSTFMVARKGRETGGILAFGPFVRLQRGRYEAEFELVMETDRPAAPARLRAAEYDGEVLADVPVAFQTGSRRTTEVISFERRGWLEVGLQVVYEGQGTLGVKKMSARLVEPLPEPSPEDDAWKAGLWCVGLTAVSIAWRRRGTCPRPRA